MIKLHAWLHLVTHMLLLHQTHSSHGPSSREHTVPTSGPMYGDSYVSPLLSPPVHVLSKNQSVPQTIPNHCHIQDGAPLWSSEWRCDCCGGSSGNLNTQFSPCAGTAPGFMCIHMFLHYSAFFQPWSHLSWSRNNCHSVQPSTLDSSSGQIPGPLDKREELKIILRYDACSFPPQREQLPVHHPSSWQMATAALAGVGRGVEWKSATSSNQLLETITCMVF